MTGHESPNLGFQKAKVEVVPLIVDRHGRVSGRCRERLPARAEHNRGNRALARRDWVYKMIPAIAAIVCMSHWALSNSSGMDAVLGLA